MIESNLDGDRVLVLRHDVIDGRLLAPDDAAAVVQHVADLWGYPVVLLEVEASSQRTLREHDPVEPRD